MDYVTEKVYHALITGAVPVYDGAPNANDYLPGGWDSVIATKDFMNGAVVDFPALATKLKNLESSQSEELKLLQRWTHAESEMEWGEQFLDHLHHGEPTCELCDMARWKKCGRELW
jgi:hypothetical protein